MENHWTEDQTQGLTDLDLLVYVSRLIGAEPGLVIWGGGNTSLKVNRRDFRGLDTKAMLVKASGADMKSIEVNGFSLVRMEDILTLSETMDMSDLDVVEYLEQCLMNPRAPRPSIETLLHAFLPQVSVIHSHADAILSLTNTRNPEKLLSDVYGNDVVVVPYRRPGFLLSKEVALAALKRPGSKGAVLLNHGLVTWGATPKASYDMHIELVNMAEEYIERLTAGKVMFGGLKTPIMGPVERARVAAAVTPNLRAIVSSYSTGNMLVRFDDSSEVLDFVSSNQAKALAGIGAATPDHLLQTKMIPLLVEAPDPSYIGELRRAIEAGIEGYRSNYTNWFQENRAIQDEMHDPNPKIILVPGLGMWVTGRDMRALTVASDIYHHTISIMAAAQNVDMYSSLSSGDAYDAEYWPLELYKLTLIEAEKELSRKIALVTGAAKGIGKAIAKRLAQEGAHVILTDIDEKGVHNAAESINEEIGIARCVAMRLDVTDQQEVSDVFQRGVLTLGGLDILVSNAGIATTGTLEQLAIDDWHRSLEINATGHLLVSQEAVRVMKEQGLGGSLLFIATKNVTAPGYGFGAYSAAKAAETQLARVMAIENGAYGIRCNIINPDAIFQDSGLWSQELREERAMAHGVSVENLEDYYRQRNLLQAFITPNDVAEAALFLVSNRSAKTTGCIITVDGGVPAAFPR